MVVCTVITAVGRLRQDNLKFDGGLSYIGSLRPAEAKTLSQNKNTKHETKKYPLRPLKNQTNNLMGLKYF